ncbi:unnamed protein product [Notodromas monacha]|uniref:Protein DP71L n=1 Tax=Notodromas monacha TaxID=399045 RepID=A0A7R9GCL3_9CRUS|nr:unnamed protein product [Notodromas monacha]CAG0916229.1 unnamed protein product [Notodromas monacha]
MEQNVELEQSDVNQTCFESQRCGNTLKKIGRGDGLMYFSHENNCWKPPYCNFARGFHIFPGNALHFMMPTCPQKESMSIFPVMSNGMTCEDPLGQFMDPEVKLDVLVRSKLNPNAPEFRSQRSTSSPSVLDIMTEKFGIVHRTEIVDPVVCSDMSAPTSWRDCRNPLILSILGDDSSDIGGDDEEWDCVDGYDPQHGNSTSQKTLELARKRVHFKEEVQIHELDDADEPSRAGPWHSIYLDSVRFRDRVVRVESLLSSVLQPDHRSRIYESRFSVPSTSVPR